METLILERPVLERLRLEDLRAYRLEKAYKAGFIEPGWTYEDYLRNAVRNYRWECVPIWGIKGSFKSNRLMWSLYQIYQDWSLVHEHIIMEPEEFVELLNTKGRIPAVGWDDIGAWLDSQLYFEDRQLYAQIKRNWKLTRTKMSVFLCTIPIKTDLPTFILDDMTSELFCSPRMMTTYDRWIWEKDERNPRKVVKRAICIHENKPFNIHEVPTEEFKKYWKRRLRLANIGRDRLVKALRKAFRDAPVQLEDEPVKPIEGFTPEEAKIIRRYLSQIGRRGGSIPRRR